MPGIFTVVALMSLSTVVPALLANFNLNPGTPPVQVIQGFANGCRQECNAFDGKAKQDCFNSCFSFTNAGIQAINDGHGMCNNEFGAIQAIVNSIKSGCNEDSGCIAKANQLRTEMRSKSRCGN
ncbi:uncharacterized protein VTP21DRAFT_4300 [Calcarisporiella thermophila]|uniref:uncharacterized protein n=1 Tax=Calcarisporiella thermophila TaxID=911321 RepID=UPI0037444054